MRFFEVKVKVDRMMNSVAIKKVFNELNYKNNESK